MRFVTVTTIFVTVFTLAIHGLSVSSFDAVKQTDQVHQVSSYLSKREDTTCAFEDGANDISLEKKERLYAILTKIYGSDDGCQVTNSLLRFSTSSEFSGLPDKDSRIDKRSNEMRPHRESSSRNPRRRHPRNRISRREERDLRAILTVLFGEQLGPVFTIIVIKYVKPEIIVESFKTIYGVKNSNKLLSNLYDASVGKGTNRRNGDGLLGSFL